jgi:Lipopolysaccharide kinase (Kdo/WaaP) family
MIQQWVWGYTPPGFRVIRSGRTQIGIARRELTPYLSLEGLKEESADGKEASAFFGRGQLKVLRLKNGETVLVRPYRHGGLVRWLTEEIFVTWPPRPFKELAITEEARRRGLPTLEIFAAWIERIWGPFYRGWLVTRELKGANDLWSTLRNGLYTGSDKKSLLLAVAQSIRTMHHQGIYHGDLNLKNILVRNEAGRIRTYIIDFDKAQLFGGVVPPCKAKRNLSRLLRSARKLDPDRQHLSQRDWELFMHFFHEADAG